MKNLKWISKSPFRIQNLTWFKNAFPHSRKAGFSLIELLFALALLSLILGALYSTFFLSYKAVEGMDNSLVKLQECRMAIDTISREIDSILYLPTSKELLFKVEDRDIYGKQASRFTFNAFSPLIPGLSTISYYGVEERDGGFSILKKLHSSCQPAIEEKGVEVVDHVEAFLVEAREKEKWVKTWDASRTNGIPEEVRITIMISMKDRKLSLSETVRPKIGKAII